MIQDLFAGVSLKELFLTSIAVGGGAGLIWRAWGLLASLWQRLAGYLVLRTFVDSPTPEYMALAHFLSKRNTKRTMSNELGLVGPERNEVRWIPRNGFFLAWNGLWPVVVRCTRYQASHASSGGLESYVMYANVSALRPKDVEAVLLRARREYEEFQKSTARAPILTLSGADVEIPIKLVAQESLFGSPIRQVFNAIERGAKHILLYGPPGNGKTSAIMAIVGHYRLDAIAFPANVEASRLMNVYLRSSPGTVIVLEEVDKLVFGDEKAETLQAMLQILDGMYTRPDVYFFMTTNYHERLDPALVRPGRTHARIEFSPPSPSELAAFAESYGLAPDLLSDCHSWAEAKQELSRELVEAGRFKELAELSRVVGESKNAFMPLPANTDQEAEVVA